MRLLRRESRGSKKRRKRARKAFTRLLKQVRRACKGAQGPQAWGPLFQMVQGVYGEYEADLPGSARLSLQDAALQVQDDASRHALAAA